MSASPAAFAVTRPTIVLLGTAAFFVFGWTQFQRTPIEVLPDVGDPQVEIVAQFPGRSAEEVERQVASEIERVLKAGPKVHTVRSRSVYGLAIVTAVFEPDTTEFQTRSITHQQLEEAILPQGASARIGPLTAAAGQIFRYTLHGPRSLKDLRDLQDFVVSRRLEALAGVAKVVTFGGVKRCYELRVDPARLAALEMSFEEVHDAAARSNSNSEGGSVQVGGQEFVVQGVGSLVDPADLKRAVIRTEDGFPIRIGDVAEVVEGAHPRRGVVGRGANGDVVEGIVLLARNRDPGLALVEIHDAVRRLNKELAVEQVTVSPFYDRAELMELSLAAVGEDLLQAALIAFGLVFVCLHSFRAAFIAAVVLASALFSAVVGLRAIGLPMNLVSLGAVDVGVLLTGMALALEARFRLAEKDDPRPRLQQIYAAAATSARPALFATLILLASIAPIFALEHAEGRIFKPLAYTYLFALAGGLAAVLLVEPALEVQLGRRRFHFDEPWWITGVRRVYLPLLSALRRVRWLTAAAFGAWVAVLGWHARDVGVEFLPTLDEGDVYITSTFPSTTALAETQSQADRIRALLAGVPEVADVASHVGRPDDSAHADGANNAEFFVQLKPHAQWRPGVTREAIANEFRRRLKEIPGGRHQFSQPIAERVSESLYGVPGQASVKLSGADFPFLKSAAEQLQARLAKVEGADDVAVHHADETDVLRIDWDREALARRGLTVGEVQQTIGIALGGLEATEFHRGEEEYGVSIRLPEAIRGNAEALGRLSVGKAADRVTLAELAVVTVAPGRSSIWREGAGRTVAVSFSARGRDLGSVARDAQAAAAGLSLPSGISLSWTGEHQALERAMQRLAVAAPLALALIGLLLTLHFRDVRPAIATAVFPVVAALGAAAALRLLDMHFSVSAAVGCLVLAGQASVAGAIVCTRINEALREGASDPLLRGAGEALRPLLMTTALAGLCVLPAALAQNMGSEAQRPFAVVVATGLAVVLPSLLLFLPLLYGALLGLDRPAAAPLPNAPESKPEQAAEPLAAAVAAR